MASRRHSALLAFLCMVSLPEASVQPRSAERAREHRKGARSNPHVIADGARASRLRP